MERKRSPDEVREAFWKFEQAFENLVLKHEEFVQLIEDDEEYDKEEQWITDSQQSFMSIDIEAKTYLEIVVPEIVLGNLLPANFI